jgi:hypothetical protein
MVDKGLVGQRDFTKKGVLGGRGRHPAAANNVWKTTTAGYHRYKMALSTSSPKIIDCPTGFLEPFAEQVSYCGRAVVRVLRAHPIAYWFGVRENQGRAYFKTVAALAKVGTDAAKNRFVGERGYEKSLS